MEKNLSVSGPRFTIFMDALMEDYNLHPYALAVYLAILSHTYTEDNTAFPSVKRIAKLATMSKKSVHKYIKVLEDEGLLEVTRRYTDEGDLTSNFYHIIHPTGTIKEGGKDSLGGYRDSQQVGSDVHNGRERRSHEEEPLEQEPLSKNKNSSPPEKPADGRENGTPPDDPTPDAVTAPQETDTDPDDEPTVTDSTDTPTEITWQHAVAFYHDWRTEDGALDTNHRLANTYLSFFGGRSKKGEWKDFRFESGDWTEPGMLAGFRLWYKTYQTKQGLPDSAIPTSPQSINSWGLRYLSLSAKNLRAWNEKGAQRLRAEVYGDHDTDAYEAENAVPENYNPYTAQ